MTHLVMMADIRCLHCARGSVKLIERGEDQDKKEKQSARYSFILSHQTKCVKYFDDDAHVKLRGVVMM